MARILGLTGNIACGKTSIGHMLLELGAERYIDADALVHHLYSANQPIALKVGETFGPSSIAPDGSVDRKALGKIVFENVNAMQELEKLVHPAVHTMLKNELATVSASGIAIVDAVKLLEGSSAGLCLSKWLVLCPQDQQLARLMSRNHLSYEEALLRAHVQPDRTAALALVDEIINNGSSLDETHIQVSNAFNRFCEKFPS